MPDRLANFNVGRFETWFAMLGGAIAWTLHLLLAYAISEFGCVAGWDRIGFLGMSIVAWMLLAVSVVLLGVAVAATIAGYQIGRKLPPPRPELEAVSLGNFAGRFGLLTSGLFALIIAVESVPIFYYLDQC